jgi:hypothetical protein
MEGCRMRVAQLLADDEAHEAARHEERGDRAGVSTL